MKTPERIAAIYRIFAEQQPEPQTELNYGSHFQLLVAVMLSANTTDKAVNKATAELFPIAPDAQAIMNMDPERLKLILKQVGMYQTKTRHLLALAQQIVQRYQGQVPNDKEALLALPGVGIKTANVVLNAAFGAPLIAVDTHVFRVANRTQLATGKTAAVVEQKLMQVTPEAYLGRAHHWLVLHGRYVCKAQRPRCAACLIAALCPSHGRFAS